MTAAPKPLAVARVSAIVPAYNEEETLADVLSVLRQIDLVDEILVVSDGSTDRTVEIAGKLAVKAIHLRTNRGKGTALAVGVEHASAPILVFVDGDILNLSDYLLRRLIEPVVEGRAAMNIGIRSRGWLVDAIHRRTGPLLSGIRCLERRIFEAVPDDYLAGYRVEAAMNWTCQELGGRCTTTVLYGLKHRVKEKKLGFREGLRSRLRMFWSVLCAFVSLHIRQPRLRVADTPPLATTELEYTNF